MPSTLELIISHLQHAEKLHHKTQALGLVDALRVLQDWQTKRLLATYQDLWQSKRFRPAMEFFIDELYGPKDFSQRDQEIARVVPKMAKLLPNQALQSLEAALQLNSLSHEMDLNLTEHLVGKPVTRETYAQAYRLCDNRAQREQQLRLLEGLGEDLADVVKIKGISALLMLSRKPAKVAGVESLHSFLETGYKSFKRLGNVDDFIGPIVTRERQLMEGLFAQNDENPLPEID
ncbi:FFLEELY motif protein [Aliiglaciecola litoralis]|uniref:DUF8198 domain-containing protein n=1 Tax=Aliiglaciecola litoralis TaxID=582857 RepID=A0ABN1LPE6_9ALTE